jgi:hypothetical protein
MHALIWIKVLTELDAHSVWMEWRIAFSAPFDRDLELAVIDRNGVHALVSVPRLQAAIMLGGAGALKSQLTQIKAIHDWRVPLRGAVLRRDGRIQWVG